jgi:hypothetical protein
LIITARDPEGNVRLTLLTLVASSVARPRWFPVLRFDREFSREVGDG